ncbi:MAG: 2-oxoglutarate dehydrogenase E2 component (dihydrolipoamide succinyltransferase) [Saprospiraceae bacterium]|jgi:2-oxoglutarate dehydrogenase E2 component (dihydrolipoamide succinyltransferase)
MAQVELIMPKMGESIIEATILKWAKKVGDTVEVDETILEIATDKVDSEIPSPVSGTIAEILFAENDVVEIGKTIAIIATEGEEVNAIPSPAAAKEPINNGHVAESPKASPAPKHEELAKVIVNAPSLVSPNTNGDRFYSPLVKNIAKQENIAVHELDAITGSGLKGRVTKNDIMAYLADRTPDSSSMVKAPVNVTPAPRATQPSATSVSGNVEIVEMDRMRKLIADHMVMSKHTSPHVTSFVEVDVTNIVNWRNNIKETFQKKYNEKITFTPIFIQAVARALSDFPMVNVSVDGTKIIVKKDINIGMAAALPSGNLIVPVIKGADQLNLVGLTKVVNDLAGRARINKLKPADIQDGTFTLTNVGTFGNVMGTPIINQPQAAILAVGAIQKKPAVVETEYGDLIAIRQMMFLSLSYDHRVVDGFLGGSFLRRVGDYLEAFDHKQTI